MNNHHILTDNTRDSIVQVDSPGALIRLTEPLLLNTTKPNTNIENKV